MPNSSSSSRHAGWKAKLKASGKTQGQLASELGISASEVSKVLNNRSAKETSVSVVGAYFEEEEEEEQEEEEQSAKEEEGEKESSKDEGKSNQPVKSITAVLNASTSALIGAFAAKKKKKEQGMGAPNTGAGAGVDNTRYQKRAKKKSNKALADLRDRVQGETARRRNEALEQRGLSSAFERSSYLDRESKRERKHKAKTAAPNAGNGWYGMQAPEMNDKLKRDLAAIRELFVGLCCVALRFVALLSSFDSESNSPPRPTNRTGLRGYADPKRFYKASDGTPRVFQVGTVVSSAADGASGRLTRKERKQTVLDDVAASGDSLRYTKKTFGGIAKSKQSRAKANRKVNGKRKRGYY